MRVAEQMEEERGEGGQGRRHRKSGTRPTCCERDCGQRDVARQQQFKERQAFLL